VAPGDQQPRAIVPQQRDRPAHTTRVCNLADQRGERTVAGDLASVDSFSLERISADSRSAMSIG
jgi:hypothetical protein